jgi:hypothetical protein
MAMAMAMAMAAYLILPYIILSGRYQQPVDSPAPAVGADEEAVFYFYNLQPIHNQCPGDYYGRSVCGDYYPCNATARSYRMYTHTSDPSNPPANQAVSGMTALRIMYFAPGYSLMMGLVLRTYIHANLLINSCVHWSGR